MPVQHSPPAKNTRSQRNPAVLTPTARVRLDHTISSSTGCKFGQRATNGRRSTLQKRGNEIKKIKIILWPGEEYVEEEDSGETEVADDLENAPEVPQGPNLSPTNQPLVSQSDPSLLKIIEQMATIMGHLSQTAAPRDNSKAPAFKTPSMKAPDSFDGTQAYKLREFIQSCQLIFQNDPANFFSDRKKFWYSTSFLTGRAGKWTEPYV
ncbi:hypothetical protein O181_031777 [Austropuccinia psidii MF-1]|uniref:DUF4939 domain-containing protein n=1 Tax=Austropuccinia psidii MF-1 TaxID=1389203 RepID=A0A9Q3D1B4_9BASI|nr:hypothetical protein [Austropuccinia psidii MF-1]